MYAQGPEGDLRRRRGEFAREQRAWAKADSDPQSIRGARGCPDSAVEWGLSRINKEVRGLARGRSI